MAGYIPRWFRLTKLIETNVLTTTHYASTPMPVTEIHIPS